MIGFHGCSARSWIGTAGFLSDKQGEEEEEDEEKEEEEAREQMMAGGDSSLGEAACFRGWNAARRAL